jgi:membrane protease subunit HflK
METSEVAMKRFLLSLAVVGLVGYLATGVYQVRPGERAVVRRCGRVLGEARLPGLNVGLPWGFDRVDIVAVDEQRQISAGYLGQDPAAIEAAPPGQVLTGDNNLIDIRALVYYRVDSDHAADFVLNADRVESLLARAAEQALTDSLASQRIDTVLLGQARHLESTVQSHLLHTMAGYQLGVTVESVNLTYVQPPVELAEVFREVNRARTQKEIAEREALTAKQTNLSVARQDSRRVLTAAAIAMNDRLTRAKTEAANFLDRWRTYQQADGPNALLTLYLKEMQPILARFQARTISDKNIDQTVVMPLPEK